MLLSGLRSLDAELAAGGDSAGAASGRSVGNNGGRRGTLAAMQAERCSAMAACKGVLPYEKL